MKDATIIRVLLASQTLFETTLAHRVGKSKNAIHSVLHQRAKTGHMRTDIFVELTKALDYKVVVMPARQRTPEGGFVLTIEDENFKETPKYEDITPDKE